LNFSLLNHVRLWKRASVSSNYLGTVLCSVWLLMILAPGFKASGGICDFTVEVVLLAVMTGFVS
jgi:hypothetical protein